MAFLTILQTEQLDYTGSFLRFQNKEYEAIKDDCIDRRQFEAFFAQYEIIGKHQNTDALDTEMLKTNQVSIRRIHMAQTASEQD